MKRIIAVDPGANGAIVVASIDDAGVQMISIYNMPDTDKDLWDVVSSLSSGLDFSKDSLFAYIERVGGYMPGNSGPASVKFADHCGALRMAFIAAEIPLIRILPHTWMKSVMGALPKDKKARKNLIKAEMQRRYPHIKVTLNNADALGILTYALQNAQ